MAVLARGNVSDRPWGMTLGALGLRGLTGQLTLTCEGKQYRVAFNEGAVVGAQSPLANDAAVRIALTGNLITSSQVGEITRRMAAAPTRDEVEVLAELCRLGPEQTMKLRRRLVAQRAARTFSVDSGEFVVEDQTTISVVAGTELDVRAVIYLGATNNLSEERLAAELAQLGVWFKIKQEAVPDLPQYGFTETEKPALRMLLVGANLIDIEAAYPGVGGRSVRAICYALAVCGACETGIELRGAAAERKATAARPMPTPIQTVPRGTPPPGSKLPSPEEVAAQAQALGRSPSQPMPRITSPSGNPRVGGGNGTREPSQPMPRITSPGSARLENLAVPSRTTNEHASQTMARTTTEHAPQTERGPQAVPRTTTTERGPQAVPRTTTERAQQAVPRTTTERGPQAVPRTTTERAQDLGIPSRTTTERSSGQHVIPSRTASERAVVPSRTASEQVSPARTTSEPRVTGRESSQPLSRQPSQPLPRQPSQPLPRVTGREPSQPISSRTTTPPSMRTRALSAAPPPVGTTMPRAKRNTAATSEVDHLLETKIPLVEKSVDHFTLLGLPIGASAEDVRTTYFMLARKLHPDRLAAIGVDDEDRQAQRLMAHINTAFAVLNDPVKRADYMTVIERGGDAAIKKEEAKADELAMRVMRAEEAFKQGEMALRREQLTAAVASFQQAVELQPQEAEYQALLAWSQFAAANDKQAIASTARKALMRAAEANERSPTARFYLGRIERMLGREREALAQFYEVLSIRPNHAEAASEVRILEQRLKSRR